MLEFKSKKLIDINRGISVSFVHSKDILKTEKSNQVFKRIQNRIDSKTVSFREI